MDAKKTCDNCVCKEVCKILSGEMLIRYKDLKQMDLGKELKKFKKELASKCSDYLRRTRIRN